MAFSTQEQEIVKWGVSNGKSRQEVEDALVRYRTGQGPKVQPVEQAISPSYGGSVKQAALSGVEKIKEGFAQQEAATSPISVLEAGSKVGAGVIETVASPLVPLLSPIGKLIGYVSNKIAEIPAVQEFSQTKAGEVTSRVAEDVQNLSTIAGAVTGAKAIPPISKVLGRVASESVSALAGVAEKGIEGIKSATSKQLDPSAIMQRVARISKGKQAKFEQTAKESVGKYLVNRGIFGNIDDISTQLYNRFNTSKTAADDALAKLEGNYKVKPVETALDELLARETKVSSPGAFSRDFARVRELRNKYQREGLNMSEINEVKRLFERNVKLDFLKENAPVQVERANNLDSAIRNWQFTQAEKLGLKNLPDINRETRLAKQLLDDLGKEYAGSAGNNAITLTDWIILSGGDPTAIGAFLAKKTVSSKGIQSKIAQQLSPEPTIGTPTAEFGVSTIDGYLEFLKAIEGRAKQP